MNLSQFFVVVVLASLSLAQSCLKTVKLNDDEKYKISTPQDPSRCYWNFQAPKGSFVTTKCHYSMSQSNQCGREQIKYVYSASKSATVCGEGEMNIISLKRRFGLGVEISDKAKYSCTVTASRPDNPNNCACGWYPPEFSDKDMEYYPFLAALTSNGKIFAAATIISRHYALTTAKAIKMAKNQNGLIQLAVRGQRKGTIVYHSVTARAHDKYNGFNNNIALIKTDVPISFSSYVGPICLPYTYRLNSEHFTNMSTILGFQSDDMKYSQVIATNLTLIPRKDCEAFLQQELHKEFKCSVVINKDKGCAHNEGSPLVWRWNASRRSYYLLYLSSLLNPCEANSINTKITQHLNWIAENTKGDFLCKEK